MEQRPDPMFPAGGVVDERHTFEFRGNAQEYFRIWIVNIALTILTLGIYSAWAKVRTKRYFLGNTVLAGSSFDYHADPVKILKGRLIMAVIFAGYFLGSKISPVLALAFIGLGLALAPWIIVRGMIFNLGNTSYRNIRFGFARDYSGAYVNYLKCLLLIVFTFGLAFAWVMNRHWWFRISRSRFGRSVFSFTAEGSDFFGIYFGAGAAYLAGAILVGIFGGSLMLFLGSSAGGMIAGVLLYAPLLFGAAHIRARSTNLVCSSTRLKGGFSFAANLKTWEFFVLYLTNLLACIFTLGLMIPWAMVRTAQYRLSHTQVIAPLGAIDQVVAAESADDGAIAEAAVDFWDIDLGF